MWYVEITLHMTVIDVHVETVRFVHQGCANVSGSNIRRIEGSVAIVVRGDRVVSAVTT